MATNVGEKRQQEAQETTEEKNTKGKDEEEAILREICTVNGINYEKLIHGMGNAKKTKCLEVFFFGCSKIVGLSHFPTLSCLRVINQNINSMVGVGECPTLKELWICEGNIEVIEDLANCNQLVKLYLYSNKIISMKGLSHLIQLEILWLNNNKIKTIEGITCLTDLKDVNLAGNCISNIGNSLSGFGKIEKLNLSGNPLTSLEELEQLYHLTSLSSLSLCDRLYSPSPICRLCNYSTLILYHMPWLVWMDGRYVDSPELRDLIKSLVNKKKQFYRLKIHNWRQLSWKEHLRLDTLHSNSQHKVGVRLRILHEHLKALKDSSSLYTEAWSSKINAIGERIESVQCSLVKLKDKIDQEKERVDYNEDRTIKEWLLELQSAGNVRYILGNEEYPWYKPCVELVTSRFMATGTTGITHLKITSVLRIESSLLYNRFMDTLGPLLEEQSIKPSVAFKDLVDYLFLVWYPGAELVAMGHKGCGSPDKSYVTLTNSVGVAEATRFSGCGEGCGPLKGELLLCKVYVGNIKEHSEGEIPRSSTSTHCLYRNITNVIKSLPQREYFVYDSHLVLPEYLINVLYERVGEKKEEREEEIVGKVKCDDNELLKLSPQPEVKPKLVMLDETVLLRITNQKSLENIKELDLSCNRLTRFRYSSLLPHLSSLSLSCNELATAEDFSHMNNLQVLNLSFNRLTGLDGIKALPKLHSLNVSWNALSFPYQDVVLLKRHTPSLQTLDMRYNLWKENITPTVYVLGTLHSLQSFNGHLITEQEREGALKQFVSSHLSLSSLLSYCRTNSEAPPTLLVSTLAEQIVTNSRLRPVQLNTSLSTDWTDQVTAIDLSGQQIYQLTCLDQLPNLKWVCLKNNSLTSIEGLESCTKIEELTLDGNYLQHSLPLHHFPHLKWLSLENNRLNSLPLSSSPLPSLLYLNVSRNNIRDINGIESLVSLQELYVSHNFIENTRQLFVLKLLTHLIVIDFICNPLTSSSSSSPFYRLFSIYHFPSLKAIDGQAVTTSEIGLAKEKLGGKLTQDTVYERHNGQDFLSLKKLDFVQCSLKHVDLSPVANFDNLVSMNLEHNYMTSFSGLIHLNKLKVLCLNHNRIDCLIKQVGGASSSSSSVNDTPVLHSLQVLHLAYNSISSLISLHLARIPSLRALFLQGNEISKLEGLDGLHSLTELVLDRNKIKQLQEYSLQDLTQLRELHIEENRMCDLSHFQSVKYLERLYLGMNRIQEYSELEKLGCLPHLIELSIISNPISRRMQHRSLLIYKLSSLQSLDGVLVTSDERCAAEATFSDRHEEEPTDTAVLPSIANTGQVKVLNVPLYMSHGNRQAQAMEARALHLQTLQAFQDRRKGRR